MLPGGQVATTVVACQRWGMSTRYVGILGDDSAAASPGSLYSAGVEARSSPFQEARVRSRSSWLMVAASGPYFAGGIRGSP